MRPSGTPMRTHMLIAPSRIFDLRRRKDVGSLSQHQGSVTCLAFAGDGHLLSGGEDGRIGLFRCKDWECLHVLRHKKPLQSLAVHPSSKLALSVGKDRSLRLWNLMTGKQAHAGLLPHEPLRILFSASGKYYVVMGEHSLVCYEAQAAKRLFEFKSKSRLAAMAVLRDERIYLAGEGSLVQIIDIDAAIASKEGVEACTLETGLRPRIKDLAIAPYSRDDILVAGCSSGTIKGFMLSESKEELFSHESKIRITCLTVAAH